MIRFGLIQSIIVIQFQLCHTTKTNASITKMQLFHTHKDLGQTLEDENEQKVEVVHHNKLSKFQGGKKLNRERTQ